MGERGGLDSFLTGLDSPMFIVTTVHPRSGERAGCLVGFASQCSIEPDRFVVWLSQNNHTYRVAMAAELLAVHGLADDQRELAELFGTRTGDEVDKFAQCTWQPDPSGVPIIGNCPRRFVGRILDRTAWGNHTGFLLEPMWAAGEPDPPPLMYSAVRHLRAGHPA
ncbi:NADH-FMN oxidoreductase RutF, flavin reductase (DIM6/NTAB) family [Micromonospora rhizosphaerae]|uniref:NADH-FMN oxidoreductase RutF, flavin reductase (DIM6/NTAB) family n=1 Tax=Micromonospora rhizosphaerae TaxID=568872 RepID=A0A1C6RKH1_9ACTN|nr:flavin reductase family protein [Micromonospora rhizosphaerae]SCL17523.1 NADH-FMN oxidoreductase RutF, flavin reductase (DIM6/NTAB) family [Micromonospora rhizosphaerae]